MKTNIMLPLALALSIAIFATACNRQTDDTLVDQPVVAPAPVEPASTTPPPAASPADSGMSFAEMDANGDGAITPDELAETEMLHQHFSVADANGDGELSAEEVDRHRAAMAGAPAN